MLLPQVSCASTPWTSAVPSLKLYVPGCARAAGKMSACGLSKPYHGLMLPHALFSESIHRSLALSIVLVPQGYLVVYFLGFWVFSCFLGVVLCPSCT